MRGRRDRRGPVLDRRLDRGDRRSFGFSKLIEKIGVERRIYTSGTNKAMLDPFLPENPSMWRA
jgi:ClpP class serine protease